MNELRDVIAAANRLCRDPRLENRPMTDIRDDVSALMRSIAIGTNAYRLYLKGFEDSNERHGSLFSFVRAESESDVWDWIKKTGVKRIVDWIDEEYEFESDRAYDDLLWGIDVVLRNDGKRLHELWVTAHEQPRFDSIADLCKYRHATAKKLRATEKKLKREIWLNADYVDGYEDFDEAVADAIERADART